MLAKFRVHLRHNVVGYIALFVALGGTAYAANTVGSSDIIDESILSQDLKNGEVKSPDIFSQAVIRPKISDGAVNGVKLADGAVDSAKVLDDTQAGGGLAVEDLRANSVGQSEIATDGVAALEIQDNSIDSGEIVDFTLTNQDVGVLFAEVNAAATLANSSGSVAVTRVGAVGAGTYEVDFARNVAACTAVATIGPAGNGSALGEVNVADRSANVEAVFVDTNTSTGAAADKPFRLVVVC